MADINLTKEDVCSAEGPCRRCCTEPCSMTTDSPRIAAANPEAGPPTQPVGGVRWTWP